MRNVWFFGDSSTYCHGLRPGFEFHDNFIHLKDKRWNEYISEYFGGVELNFGLCGGSNDDILFRLITNLKNIKNNDVVFIQWTHPSRFGVFINSEFRPINIFQLNEIKIHNLNDTDNNILKQYMNRFLIENLDNLHKQTLLKLISIKKELELRNIICIMWSPNLLSERSRKIYNWNTIYDESNKEISDNYHLGFSAQKPFSDFLINQFENGNTLIKEINEFWETNDSLNWNNNDIELELDRVFVKSNNNLHKDYDESHIFI